MPGELDSSSTTSGEEGEPSIDPLHDEHADSEDEEWVLKNLMQMLHIPTSPSASAQTRSSDVIKNSKSTADSVGSAAFCDLPVERISCPYCFVTLSLQCQRHEQYDGQFRAIFVRNCQVMNTSSASVRNAFPERIRDGKDQSYADVQCQECGTYVGVRDEEGVYHFCNVMN